MWRFLEIGIVLLIMIAVVMEIVIPVLTDKPIFPSFRSKKTPEKPVEDLVSELKTKVDEEEKATETKVKDIEGELNLKKETLDNIKKIKTKTNNL